MKMRYRELIGMPVHRSDGSRAGRVASLIAERRDQSLCVTGLVVGSSALLARIGLRDTEPRCIPWSQVDRIEGGVYLKAEPDTTPTEAGTA